MQGRLASKYIERGGILPKPVKTGDGKLKGLTIPMVGSHPVKAGTPARWGKNEKIKKADGTVAGSESDCSDGGDFFC